MKATVSKHELVTLIGKIQNIVSPKPAIPILANIMIEAVDGQLILTATDLTVSMKIALDAKIHEEGGITLPAKKFFQLIREITTPQIEIETNSSDIAIITAGSSHFKIHGMAKNEFPALPDFSSAAEAPIGVALFKEMLSRTAFAAARDDNRQVLNGVFLQAKESVLTVIGTDGKRLAKIYADCPTPDIDNASYILPLKAVEEMIRILDAKEETAKLFFMDDKVCLEAGSIVLITKLLSGQYPDVTRVIPQKSAAPIALHREELMQLLRQVSLFTSENSSSVRFSFTNGQLQLSATSGEIGEGKVNMPVNYAGPKLDIAFNPAFFIDILRNSKDETVDFDVSDSYNPGLITDSTSALFVIMPMRLEV